ncbi:MAG: aminodeoxychorismate/anthranilate synthase component II [Chitinophagaceae bacterium]|nr:aminodeoxychorismate/anthranilate synthase component II [Chitinophagaceae bacterium]HMN32068.1 aminodeoxychorismate/anthranilate synthase component II [Chitinophagaceae bacterium]
MKILVVDNYDSFTFNIIELLRQIKGIEFCVFKNNLIPFHEVDLFDKMIISPGPATPAESGDLMKLISTFYSNIPMLGICLGHQALASFFGATLENLHEPNHGVQMSITINRSHKIFSKYTSENLKVGLYHSWIVSHLHFPQSLEVTAFSHQKEIMSFKHKEFDLHGVQFHPESYMTEAGKNIIESFLFSDTV